MNKEQLIDAIQKRIEKDTGLWLKKDEIYFIADPLLKIITETLESGENVNVSGFGRFTLKYHKPKETTHVKTRKRVSVPARVNVNFKPSRVFKLKEGVLEELAAMKKTK